VAWLDDGMPDEATLRDVGTRFSVDYEAELPAFYRLLETPGMKEVLSRERFGDPLRVYREMPFAVREGHVAADAFDGRGKQVEAEAARRRHEQRENDDRFEAAQPGHGGRSLRAAMARGT
jgi:hypothetical protein